MNTHELIARRFFTNYPLAKKDLRTITPIQKIYDILPLLMSHIQDNGLTSEEVNNFGEFLMTLPDYVILHTWSEFWDNLEITTALHKVNVNGESFSDRLMECINKNVSEEYLESNKLEYSTGIKLTHPED